jgi:hypothetical protein
MHKLNRCGALLLLAGSLVFAGTVPAWAADRGIDTPKRAAARANKEGCSEANCEKAPSGSRGLDRPTKTAKSASARTKKCDSEGCKESAPTGARSLDKPRKAAAKGAGGKECDISESCKD